MVTISQPRPINGVEGFFLIFHCSELYGSHISICFYGLFIDFYLCCIASYWLCMKQKMDLVLEIEGDLLSGQACACYPLFSPSKPLLSFILFFSFNKLIEL